MCKKCKASFFFSNIHTQTYRHAHRPCSHGNGECWGSRSFQVFSSLGLSIVSAPHPFAHTCTQMHAQTHARTHTYTHTHCWYILHTHSLTLTSETAKCLSGESMTLHRSTHIHKQSQVWIFDGDAIIHFCFSKRPETHEWKCMTFEQLLFYVIIKLFCSSLDMIVYSLSSTVYRLCCLTKILVNRYRCLAPTDCVYFVSIQ